MGRGCFGYLFLCARQSVFKNKGLGRGLRGTGKRHAPETDFGNIKRPSTFHDARQTIHQERLKYSKDLGNVNKTSIYRQYLKTTFMACKRLSYLRGERFKISFNAMVCLLLGLLGVIRIIRSTADVGSVNGIFLVSTFYFSYRLYLRIIRR